MYFNLPVSTIILLLGSVVSLVNAHGRVHHVEADGQSMPGANPYVGDGEGDNKDTATRQMYRFEGSGAYNLPKDFNDAAKMSCEASGPAPKSLTVKAGSTVSVFWIGATGELRYKPGTGGLTAYNPWVHAMGPVQDYLTSCNGDCTNFDATNAGWTKIAADGLDMSASISSELRSTMSGKPEPYFPKGQGLWGMAKLVQDGSKRDVRIPANLKSGGYLLRQELSAVHSPGAVQMYVSCIQLNVVDGGDNSLPAGTNAADLYSPSGDLATYDVYSNSATDFQLPGPAIWDGASSGGGSSNSNSGSNTSSGNDNGSKDEGSGSSSDSSSSNGDASVPSRVCKTRSRRRRAISRGTWY